MIVQPPFSSLTLLSYLLTSSQETKPTSWLVCSTWRKYGNRLLLPSSNDVYKGCLPYQRFFFCYHHTKAENIFPFNFVLKKMKFSIEKINRQTPVKRRGPSTQRSKSCPPFSIKSLNVNQVVLPSYNPPFITIIRLFLHSFTRKKVSLIFYTPPEWPKIYGTGTPFSLAYDVVCSRHLIWIPPLSSSATTKRWTTNRENKERNFWNKMPLSLVGPHTDRQDVVVYINKE